MIETSVPEDSKKDRDKEYDIVVNGEAFTVRDEVVSYDQVVALAYPTPPFADTLFTVTFRKAHKPPEGTLVAGQSVEVKKKGTVFNVTATDRS